MNPREGGAGVVYEASPAPQDTTDRSAATAILGSNGVSALQLLANAPNSGTLLTPIMARDLECAIANVVPDTDDVDLLLEWQARAEAFATYLKDKDARAPMLGAARRIEARIGELLGPAEMGINQHSEGSVVTEGSLTRHQRHEFRTLAAGVSAGILRYDDLEGRINSWQGSRRSLLTMVEALVIKLGGTKASTSVEWYTPEAYIQSARDVLGGIDLDPASNPIANEVVQATTYYTREDDGLAREWNGRVFCNPPYGKGSGLFATKLVEEYEAKRVTAAIFLINAYGFDSDWFQPLWEFTMCFTDHRVKFYSPQRESGGPANGNLFVYLGPKPERFREVFGLYGAIVRRWP